MTARRGCYQGSLSEEIESERVPKRPIEMGFGRKGFQAEGTVSAKCWHKGKHDALGNWRKLNKAGGG